MSQKHPGRVITGPDTRWAYTTVWEPRITRDGRGTLLYGVQLIISKDDPHVQEIKDAIEEAWYYNRHTHDLSIKEIYRYPLRDGDIEKKGLPEYKNSYFISAYSPDEPDKVDVNCDKITAHSEIYSGCYGRVCVQFYVYKAPKEKNRYGVSCGLRSVQKIRDGEHLGRVRDVGYDFKDIDKKQREFAKQLEAFSY